MSNNVLHNTIRLNDMKIYSAVSNGDAQLQMCQHMPSFCVFVVVVVWMVRSHPVCYSGDRDLRQNRTLCRGQGKKWVTTLYGGCGGCPNKM